MKDRKKPKKKPSSRKISLRAVRLHEIRFTTNKQSNSYPTIPD
ncbi:MAG: hypothetical protein WB987_14800 [Candidatus Acidiferrales bacterium]